MVKQKPDYTEKELLALVAQNDEKAFKALYDSYCGRLFDYTFSIIKSRQVAEELVMDVFMKIWLGRAAVIKIENFDSFLFRVAHNKSIDFLRSVARNPPFAELLWEEIQSFTNDEADTSLLQKEFEEHLREAVSLLSPQRKKVYHLSREQDLNHHQIALQLGLSKNTVNNHIVEAQRFIRAYMAKNLDVASLLIVCAAGSLGPEKIFFTH